MHNLLAMNCLNELVQVVLAFNNGFEVSAIITIILILSSHLIDLNVQSKLLLFEWSVDYFLGHGYFKFGNVIGQNEGDY